MNSVERLLFPAINRWSVVNSIVGYLLLSECVEEQRCKLLIMAGNDGGQ